MECEKEVIHTRTLDYTLHLTHEELECLEFIMVFLQYDQNYRDSEQIFAGELFRKLRNVKECYV